MNYSLKHLKKMANLNSISDDLIINALNNLGFEVESHLPFIKAKGLIIGEIESISSHPNANLLKILKVNIGNKIIQIITGANNTKEKMQVIVCMPGSECNNIKYDIKTLRGEESFGMLASLNELGIDKKYLPSNIEDGIHIFDSIYENGANALEALSLDDIIINIDLLSNRADAYGYYFLAKELSGYFFTQIDPLTFKKNDYSYKSNLIITKGLENHISLFESDILKGKSDYLTQLLLIKSSIKPINKTIDLTNLALILFGQAVHAYDKDKIQNNFECKLFSGDLKTINDDLINLKDNLVVFNNDIPVAIAGVIGLKNTMITSNSKKVVFEIASFNSKYIRDTIKKSKINNITGIRNTKPSSLNIIPLVIDFLQNSLKNFSNVINPYIKKDIKIILDDQKINEYAGFLMTENKNYKNAIKFLKNIGYIIKKNEYIIPFYRYDVTNEYDIIEDIFRGYGYNNIPKIQPSTFSSLISNIDDYQIILSSQNYGEIITYSLEDEENNDFNPFNITKSIKIINPISSKRSVYRHTLINSMFKIANQNIKYRSECFSLFEIGYINGFLNQKHIALISTLKNFRDMKIDILSLLSSHDNIEFRKTEYKYLNESVSADIYLNDEYIGFIGKIHPAFSLKNSKYLIAEIKVDNKRAKQINNFINKKPLTIRIWTINLKNKDNVGKYINELKTKVKLDSIKYIETYKKNSQERAITFKLSLSKDNAKVFDQIY